MWHARDTRARADMEGCGGAVALVVCVAFNFQPGSVADGETSSWVVGRSWSWLEGSLDPFLCFPGAVCPFRAPRAFPYPLVLLLFSLQRQASGSWGRCVDPAVGTDPAFTMAVTAIARSRRFPSQRQKWGLVIGKGGGDDQAVAGA